MDVREQGVRRIGAVTAGIVAVSAAGATAFGLLAHANTAATASKNSPAGVTQDGTDSSPATTPGGGTSLGSTDQDSQAQTGGS
jgi:hypothetical protein